MLALRVSREGTGGRQCSNILLLLGWISMKVYLSFGKAYGNVLDVVRFFQDIKLRQRVDRKISGAAFCVGGDP